MNKVWSILARIQVSGQSKEWLWITGKISDVKYRFWTWDIVLLEIIIESSTWRSEEKEGKVMEKLQQSSVLSFYIIPSRVA